jgi:hypothetical protein
MFVQSSAEVALPAAQAERALLYAPDVWLPGLVDGARDQARRLLAEVGVSAGGHRVKRQVEVQLGQPLRVTAGLALPLRWHATHAPALFPEMDAELVVAPSGPDRTRITLSGQYAPPLGPLGRTVDRLVLYRVAQATASDFVERVAARLAVATPSGSVPDRG